jgi:hypothetical protein
MLMVIVMFILSCNQDRWTVQAYNITENIFRFKIGTSKWKEELSLYVSIYQKFRLLIVVLQGGMDTDFIVLSSDAKGLQSRYGSVHEAIPYYTQ